jgi:hypothetical protein
LVRFQFGAITNKTAVNIHVQVSAWKKPFISLGLAPRSAIVGWYGRWMRFFFFPFQKLTNCFPEWQYHFMFSNNVWVTQFLCTLASVWC